jgi:light-harvesting protein B-800-850 alpha chain
MSAFGYDPNANDYKIWLVLNPAKWLVPIWISVLAVAVLIHFAVLSSPKYNGYMMGHPAATAAVK